jgi:hypothetical protein
MNNIAEGLKRVWISIGGIIFLILLIMWGGEIHLPFKNIKYIDGVEPSRFTPKFTEEQTEYEKALLEVEFAMLCPSVLRINKPLCEGSTTQEWQEWDSASKILAITTKQYWQETVSLLMVLTALTSLWWGAWIMGVWIIRGFKEDKTG